MNHEGVIAAKVPKTEAHDHGQNDEHVGWNDRQDCANGRLAVDCIDPRPISIRIDGYTYRTSTKRGFNARTVDHDTAILATTVQSIAVAYMGTDTCPYIYIYSDENAVIYRHILHMLEVCIYIYVSTTDTVYCR